jgi:hypothetical protein
LLGIFVSFLNPLSEALNPVIPDIRRRRISGIQEKNGIYWIPDLGNASSGMTI